MAWNLRKSISESRNRSAIRQKEEQEARIRQAGKKVKITVERKDGKKYIIHTYGIPGRVQIDDYDESRVKQFLGHNLGVIREALKSGRKFVDMNERVSFEFTALPAPKRKRPSDLRDVFGRPINR
jgi:hypothetical protein